MQLSDLGLLAVLLSSHCALAVDDIYYSDLTDPPEQLIIGARGIEVGGVLSHAEFCSPNSDYRCFSSEGFRFAVPKAIKNKSSWIFDGVRYSITKKERFSIFGTGVEVVFIEQINKNGVYKFIFSDDYGLLGFSVDSKAHRFFMLENRCGFGASSNCKQSRTDPE